MGTYNIVSYRIMSPRVTSYRTIYRITSCHSKLYRIVSRRISYRTLTFCLVRYQVSCIVSESECSAIRFDPIISDCIIGYRGFSPCPRLARSIFLHRCSCLRPLLYRIVSYRVVSCRIVPYRIVSLLIASYRIVSVSHPKYFLASSKLPSVASKMAHACRIRTTIAPFGFSHTPSWKSFLKTQKTKKDKHVRKKVIRKAKDKSQEKKE